MNELGGALRAARAAAGVSLSVLAVRTNYSKALLGHIETGRRTILPEHVDAYERELGVRVPRTSRGAASTDATLLAQAVDVITAVGLRHGGLAALDMTRAHQAWAKQVLSRTTNDAVRSAVRSQLARLTGRYAWGLGDAGQPKHARLAYASALDLAPLNDPVRMLLMVDMAAHELGCTQPLAAIEILTLVRSADPVTRFSANGVRARAYALLGDLDHCRRYIGMADEEWAAVVVDDIPRVYQPFISGHDGHAHHAAGKALHDLSRRGHPNAAQAAVDRLEKAVTAFGSDRARARDRCQMRLDALRNAQ